MAAWQVQTAKARFSELLRAVRDSGPQTITVHGKEEFVVVRKDAFEQRQSESASILDAFRPVLGIGVNLKLPPRGYEERPTPFEDSDDEDET